MVLIGAPWAGKYDVDDPASGPQVESDLNAIKTVVDGNIDYTNIKANGGIRVVDLDTGTLLHHRGPSTKEKYLRGVKTVASGVGGSITVAVTFATDCDNPTGATAFSVAPRVYVMARKQAAWADWRLVVMQDASPSTTAVTFTISPSSLANFASDQTITLEWLAVGSY